MKRTRPTELTSAPAAGAEFDFSGLTPAQSLLMTFGGWSPGAGSRKQPLPSTARALVQRGLLVERDILFAGVVIKTYEAPVAIHRAWCEWCSAQEGAKA